MLTLTSLQVYSDRALEALRDVSLEVRSGQIVALPGSNGAGTSTVLEAFSGSSVLVSRAEAVQRVANGRSGDEGDTADVVRACFAHIAHGDVRRCRLPGPKAFDFMLGRALGGGGVASLRDDPQGKAFAQRLLDLELEVPASLLESLQ